MNTRDSKRILSVTIKREVDTDPDTSFMGEFSDDPNEYAIVHVGEHSGTFVDQLPCECGHAYWQHARENDPRLETEDFEIGQCYVKDCDCEDIDPVLVDRGREFRYFNAPIENYEGEPETEIRKYAQRAYRRACDLNNQQWYFLGVRAVAQVQITGDLVQSITSGGLWGIESDSGSDYLKEVEGEQLSELKAELHAIGFTKRAITAAFRNVKQDNE